MTPVGWLNNPNGLCQKDGIYPIYYQYTPFDSQGGIKLWRHKRKTYTIWLDGDPDTDYHNQPTIDYGWQHALTIPKELTYRNDQLYQTPVKEMKSLRERKYELLINEFNELKIHEICYEMNINFNYLEDFHIQLREDVYLKYQNHVLTLSLHYDCIFPFNPNA